MRMVILAFERARRFRSGSGVVLALLFLGFFCSTAEAQRAGDRFGLRIGVWPQEDAAGLLGKLTFVDPELDSIHTVFASAPGTTALIVEGYVLFHLHDELWIETSLGWTRRRNVAVVASLDRDLTDTSATLIILGYGKIDLVPTFVGLRGIYEIGGAPHPHTLFGRAGASLVFASESPEIVNDRIRKNGFYNEGTEASLGYLIGVGGEYYLLQKVAVSADLSYRHNNFHYSDEANFDLSSIVIMAGLSFRIR